MIDIGEEELNRSDQSVWLNSLKELDNLGSSIRSMAVILGVDPCTVKIQLAKLNGDSKEIPKKFTEELQVRRDRMLQAITLYHHEGRKVIRSMNITDYKMVVSI